MKILQLGIFQRGVPPIVWALQGRAVFPHKTGHAVYRQHETWFGFQGNSPLASAGNYLGIFGISGQVKYLHPATGGVYGDSIPSVRTLYGESGAPSSTVNPDFVAAGVGFDVRTPTSRPRIWEHHEAQLTYTHYSEIGSSQFSFNRLEAFTSLSFDLSKSLPKPPPNQSLLDQPERPWWRNALCMGNSRKGCDIGSITSTSLLTTSYTLISKRQQRLRAYAADDLEYSLDRPGQTLEEMLINNVLARLNFQKFD